MMPMLSAEWIERLGPEVLPFERTKFNRRTEKGEDTVFIDDIIDCTATNKLPENARLLSPKFIINTQPLEGKYLWVIDRTGLKLILEATSNPNAKRGIVCHTNITGGNGALQGGELWFGEDNKVYFNNKSGRYGASTLAQRQAVLDFFQSLGYDPVQIPANVG